MHKISTDLRNFLTHDADIRDVVFDKDLRQLSFKVIMPDIDADPFDYTEEDMKQFEFCFINAELVNRPYPFESVNWKTDSGEIVGLDHYPPLDQANLEGCVLDYRIDTIRGISDGFEIWEFRAEGFTVQYL